MDNQSIITLLNEAADRDTTTARRVELVRILTHERYLTRNQLIRRVEARLGLGCFGKKAWEDTFFRDMRVAKNALAAGGNKLTYSRTLTRPGYYVDGKGSISEAMKRKIHGAIAEVDPEQIAVFKTLSPAQKFLQGSSITNLARKVSAQRMAEQRDQR